MHQIENKYEDIERFIVENAEKWKTNSVDNIKIGLLVGEDGRARKIQIDALELSPEQAGFFLDRIFSVFGGQSDKLMSIYDKVQGSYKYQDSSWSSWEWHSVFQHIDENRQKSRIVASVNHVLHTTLQHVREAEQEGLQQMAAEFNSSSQTLQSIQETYREFLRRMVRATEEREQKLKIFSLEMDRLLEESRRTGSLVTSGNGWNPLCFAAFIGDISVIKKVKQIVGYKTYSELNHGKQLPLFIAIREKQYEFAAALCTEGASINARNDSFEPLLHTLIRTCKSEQIEFCINQEWIDLNIKGSYDYTALHCAVMTGNASIVELLLRNEVVAAQKQEKDIFGRTPLDVALEEKADDVIRLLLGDSTIDAQMLPGYGIKPQKIDQNTVLAKLTQYLNLKREQDEQRLEHEKDQLTPEDYARRRHEIRDPSVLSEGGHCNGLSLLFQYYLFRGKEEEFYSIMQLFSQWDGTEESLQSIELVGGLSGNYTNLQDLMEHWINDIVWFQHLSTSNIGLPFSQNNRISQFETVRKHEEDNIVWIEKASYQFTTEELTEWLHIQSHFPENIIELGGSLHNATLKILPGGRALYYDSNIPRRIPPFESMDKLAALIEWTKLHALGKTRRNMYEMAYVYRMFTGDQKRDDDHRRTVPPEFLQRSSPNGYSKLHFAILFNDIDLFNAQLTERIDLVNVCNVHGHTPLYLAIMHGKEDMVKRLLGLANIDLSDETNRTNLLTLAIARGHENIAKLLIEKGLERDGLQIYMAVEKGQRDVLHMLIEKGVDTAEINYASGRHLKRPLHIAVTRQDREMVEILLRNGADPKTKAKDTGSVLACIADSRELGFLEFIVPLLPNLNEVDEDGFNLLHYATLKGNAPLVTLLRQSGADLTIQDKNSRTAIDIANETHQSDILALLSHL